MTLALIRADSSTAIGGGHIYRCLTLADELCQQQVSVQFICRLDQGHLLELIKSRGYRVHTLPSDSLMNAASDAQHCRTIIERIVVEFGAISHLIVDHYQLDAVWHQMLAPLCQTIAVLDDIANRPYHCDLLFDQSFGRSEQDYQPWLDERCQQLIIGGQHALVRPQFIHLRAKARIKRNSQQNIKTVLIALSATDPDNISQLVLQQLEQFTPAQQWRIKLVLTDKAQHITSIGQVIAASPLNIELMINVCDMAQLMLQADIAIGAAGTAMLERCCLGLPSLLICLADNQRHIANAMAHNGAAIAVIDSSELHSSQSSSLNRALGEFIDQPERYQKVANKAFALCPGTGANHLATQLMALTEQPKLWLHPVTKHHIDALYQWQQAPKTRQYARDTSPPSPQQHKQWFQSIINDPHIHFYIIMQGEQACGFVRLHPSSHNHKQGFEVSIALAPEAYGLGIGHRALRLLGQLHQDKHLLAYIVEQNQASIRAFAKAGFSPIKDHWYQLNRNTDES